ALKLLGSFLDQLLITRGTGPNRHLPISASISLSVGTYSSRRYLPRNVRRTRFAVLVARTASVRDLGLTVSSSTARVSRISSAADRLPPSSAVISAFSAALVATPRR